MSFSDVRGNRRRRPDHLIGEAGADTFKFNDDFGIDTIVDFGGAAVADRVDLSQVTNIVDYSDLTANHLATDNGHAVIVDGADKILLPGTSVSSLSSADFVF